MKYEVLIIEIIPERGFGTSSYKRKRMYIGALLERKVQNFLKKIALEQIIPSFLNWKKVGTDSFAVFQW